MPVRFQCGFRTFSKQKRMERKRKRTRERKKLARPSWTKYPPFSQLPSQNEMETLNISEWLEELCPSRAGKCCDRMDVKVNMRKVKNLFIASSCEDSRSDVKNYNMATLCPLHPRESLEFLCLTCDELICPLCKMADHQEHKARSLFVVAGEAKRNLQKFTREITRYEREVKAALQGTERHRQVLQDTRNEVEGHIRACHAQLQTLIDAYRDSCLLELDAMVCEVDSEARDLADRLRMELIKVQGTQQKLHEAIERGSSVNVFKMNQEMKNEWDENHVTKKCLGVIPGFLHTVEHHDFIANDDIASVFVSEEKTIEKLIRKRFGRLIKVKQPLPAVGMVLKMAFRCSEEEDDTVFSVCPTGDNKVAVSFGPSCTDGNANKGCTKSFFEDGRPSKSFNFGKCTLTREGKGRFRYLQKNRFRVLLWYYNEGLFAKGEKQHLLMRRTSSDPWRFVKVSRFLYLFCIPEFVGFANFDLHPLAFDVSSDGRSIVVINEDTNDETKYRLLFLCTCCDDCITVISVYKPQADMENFFPSDVCFCTVEGREVLLVADSENHTISMLRVGQGTDDEHHCRTGTLEFERFLLDKQHLKHAPTALNKDEQGRLWVGCKGGYVMTLQLERYRQHPNIK
ncbi:uncharacterized protein LOC112567189 [Pomacea canaliculata]|uniref:uncharacterized protein LOC112567189 n=1 Tax=Pomacea canaliculata TaxID=400727 RepID=UPI000D73A743|nr:uncharacterized protein LOC112567189 [Pomacea canaliculata]